MICSIKSMLETGKRLRRREDKVLLHFAEPGALRAFLRFGRLLGELPALTATIHGTELLRFCSNPLEKFLFRRQLRKIGKIHVLSDFNRRALLEIFPELEEKILLLPGAPARELAGRAKRLETTGKKRLSILCVGRLHPRKGQDRLLLALGSLPSRVLQRIECLFVGPVVDQKFMEEVRSKADQVDCPVSFLGDLQGCRPKSRIRRIGSFCPPFHGSSQKRGRFRFRLPGGWFPRSPRPCEQDGRGRGCGSRWQNRAACRPRGLEGPEQTPAHTDRERRPKGKTRRGWGTRWAQKHSWEKVARQLYSNA